MIVMKFGGTSVEDAAALRRACEIISRETHRPPLVVLSACAGVTNTLLAIAHMASKGEGEDALNSLDGLKKRHTDIARELLSQRHLLAKDELDQQFNELDQSVRQLAAVRATELRLLDQFASFGERWSSLLIAHSLKERGMNAEWIDARTVMVTNDDFTRAIPIMESIADEAKRRLLPLLQRGAIVVTQGFVGATSEGVTTTIGRGGSDYTAAILGSVLNVDEIQIWTDVDGILTADPSLIPTANLIKEMSFDEASELAYFGAKVLHPSTILPAMKHNIPVRVLNSKRVCGSGTLIIAQSGQSSDCTVKSIAYKEGITLITVRSSRMLMAHGFLAKVFEVFEFYGKSIDVVATSEVGVSLTIDDASRLEEIVQALRVFAEVRFEKERAVLCVVGENMKYTKGIAGRVFQALGRAGVNIELISHGGSEINLTFVIREGEIESAVRSLHEEFFA